MQLFEIRAAGHIVQLTEQVRDDLFTLNSLDQTDASPSTVKFDSVLRRDVTPNQSSGRQSCCAWKPLDVNTDMLLAAERPNQKSCMWTACLNYGTENSLHGRPLCLVHLKRRSFLTSCVFLFAIKNTFIFNLLCVLICFLQR